MKPPWLFPKLWRVLILMMGAVVASTTLSQTPPDQEDLILGGVILTYPLLTPTQTGTLTYTAGSGPVGTFVVNSQPQAVNYGTGPNNFIAPPTPALTLQFGVDKASCIIEPVTGQARNCLISPSATNTFQITGQVLGPDGVTVLNGTLLSGKVLEFGFNYTASGTDFFDLRVQVTGGLIATQVKGDLGVKIQAELSTFTGSFNQNFAASPVKPDVGSIQPLLGDRVWEDKNGNGIQDCTYAPGSIINTSSLIPSPYDTNCEPGIGGVKVYLVDCNNPSTVLATATTSSSGRYFFTSPTINPAPSGTPYCVKFDPSTVPSYCTTRYPSGPGGTLKFTQQFVGNPITDSNANPTTGVTPPVTLLPSEINRSVDAGLYCPSAIGDTVWNDANNNGIQDNLNQTNGEQGLNGLPVHLYDCSNTLLNTTTTGPAPATAVLPQVPGGAGWYGFSDLAPGCYQVKFTKPADTPTLTYTFSPQGQGTPATDSNPNPATGITSQITLATGEYNATIDAGVYGQQPPPTSSLGNFYWHDLNANGIQEPNEPGLDGVSVTLLNGSCQPLSPPITTTTAGGGLYKFSNLQAGTYCEQFGKPTNFCQFPFPSGSTPSFSPVNAPGSTAADDSNANLTTGQTGAITLPANRYDDTWDAGVYCPAQIGNFVWQDCNQNGIQDDAGNPACTNGGGYPNVTVRLLDCSGNPVTDLNGNASVTTNANGLYTFLVKPGSYIVEFVKPNGTVFTLPYAGSNPAIDSNADPTTGRTACTFVPSNTYNDTLDAGVYPPTTPEVVLKKFTNGYDGDTATGTPTITPPNGPSVASDNKVAVVAPGATVTWTYQVTNTGNEPLSNIVVTDPLATAQGATINCGSGTNTIASLAIGASATCTATAPAKHLAYSSTSPEVVPGCSDGNKVPPSPTYENTGTVTAKGQYSQTTVSDDDLSHYCNPNPAVKLVKYTNGWDANDLNGTPIPTPPNGTFAEGGSQVPEIQVGSPVTWTYRVTNVGNEPLTNLQVSDTVAGVTVVCPTITSLGVGKFVDCLATLPGGAKQLTLGTNVFTGCGGDGYSRPTYENTGFAFATGQLSQNTVSDDDLSHYCNPTPKLKLVKFTNGYDANNINGIPTPTPPNGSFAVGGNQVPEVSVGGPVTWTYRVSNQGQEPLTNVTVTDSVLAPQAIDCGSGTNIITSLPVGGSVDCTATLASAPALVNGGNVSPGCGDGRPTYENIGYASGKGQNSNTTINANPDSSHYCNPPSQTTARLKVVKTPDNGTFVQGAQVSYQIVVSNPAAAGQQSATNVQLTDTLPINGGLVWATATTTQGSCTLSGANLSCSLGTIAPQAAVTVTVTSTATTPASACQSQPNPVALATADKGLIDQDSGSLSCSPLPQLAVVKTPDNGTFAQGAQVSYTIVVSNPAPAGGQTATNVQLADTLPGNGGLVWTTATTTQGTCTNPIVGNSLSCSLGSIPAQGAVTVTVTSAASTPDGACQSQPNPAAIATSGNLTAQDSGSLSCTSGNTSGLGNYVWKDINGNGIQDADEPGINGVTVKLYSCNDRTNPVSTMSTVTYNDPSNPNPSKDGYYSFTGLAAGCYFVEFVNPGGYVFSIPLQGGDPAKDSNADPVTGRTADVNLAVGEFNPTIDAGLVPGQDECPPDGTTLPGDGKAGKLYVWQDANYVYARYDQSTNLNDNSYGTNQVGWGANAPSGKSHTFSNLTGSDKAEFIFSDKSGATVLDFYSDYVTASTNFPSGYGSLGPFGGDGSCVTGNCTAWVKEYTTSMADNLAKYCTAGVCVVSGTGGVDLELTSPPTTSPTSYTLTNPATYAKGWNFVNSYTVKIDKAAFGTAGFGSVGIGLIHNSPAKVGSNAINPQPCVGIPPSACSILPGTTTVKDKNFKWPITNNGSGKVTLSQIKATWPASNGSLSKAKFDGDVIWDGTINCVSGTCSATITSAQMTTDVKKKSIDPGGKTRTFTLEFQNNAAGATPTNYTVGLSFGAGCEVNYGQPPVTCTGKIGNFVWNDLNGDGIQNTDEPGIAGVSLSLSQGGAVKSTVTTNADGLYEFDGLCANTYQVSVATPFGYTPTITGAGTPDTDSNPNPSTVILPTDGQDMTIDFGFKSSGGGGIPLCPTTPLNGFGPNNPVAVLYVTDNGDNTVTVRYVESTGLNDNTYGTNQVGWGTNAPSGKDHTFSNLTGSDSAQFTFFNGSGAKVLDFEVDYISAKTGTPSGYGTLGVSGGDGGMLTGSAGNVLSAMTSLDKSLNSLGLCVAGNCSAGGTNLVVNSPPTTSPTSYTLPAGSPYGAWEFPIWYEVKVSKALLTGAWKVQMGLVHNSPPKVGSNAIYPIPCQ
ncbi:MAG: SdrD B-like domain-containing protein [Candidatus Competibacteraceae bacterium]